MSSAEEREHLLLLLALVLVRRGDRRALCVLQRIHPAGERAMEEKPGIVEKSGGCALVDEVVHGKHVAVVGGVEQRRSAHLRERAEESATISGMSMS